MGTRIQPSLVAHVVSASSQQPPQVQPCESSSLHVSWPRKLRHVVPRQESGHVAGSGGGGEGDGDGGGDGGCGGGGGDAISSTQQPPQLQW